jgi:hypothetical protein
VQSAQSEVKKLEEQIDQMVYNLYGLTPDEIAIRSEVYPPLRLAGVAQIPECLYLGPSLPIPCPACPVRCVVHYLTGVGCAVCYPTGVKSPILKTFILKTLIIRS